MHSLYLKSSTRCHYTFSGGHCLTFRFLPVCYCRIRNLPKLSGLKQQLLYFMHDSVSGIRAEVRGHVLSLFCGIWGFRWGQRRGLSVLLRVVSVRAAVAPLLACLVSGLRRLKYLGLTSMHISPGGYLGLLHSMLASEQSDFLHECLTEEGKLDLQVEAAESLSTKSQKSLNVPSAVFY